MYFGEFFSSSFLIYSDPSPAWSAFGLVFAVVGASLITLALFPQYKSTFKSQNTVGVNKPMFLFHTIVAFLFYIGALFMICAYWKIAGTEYFTVATGFIFASLNLFAFLGNGYVTLLKSEHSKAAKNLGISEAEYYQNNVLPNLKVRSK